MNRADVFSLRRLELLCSACSFWRAMPLLLLLLLLMYMCLSFCCCTTLNMDAEHIFIPTLTRNRETGTDDHMRDAEITTN